MLSSKLLLFIAFLSVTSSGTFYIFSIKATNLFQYLNLHYFSAFANYTKCKIENSSCIINVINDQILPNAANGIAELNIPQLEPYYVKKLTIQQDGQIPIRFKLFFKSLAYNGWSQVKVTKLKIPKGNIDNEKLNFNLYVPLVIQKASYNIDGTVIVLPIKGNGLSNMTFVESNMKFRSTTKSLIRNGEKFIQIDKAKLSIETSR